MAVDGQPEVTTGAGGVAAPRTARALARAEITRRLTEHGRAQLREAGPGELSLRAAARELGMSSSAVYRYFASRDELLTALIVEVYDEIGDVLEAADAGVRDRGDVGRRFTRMATALRAWALDHPHDWALVYGSPVVGYAAPQTTVPAAARSTGAFVVLLQRMVDDGWASAGDGLTRRQRRSVDLPEVGAAELPPELMLRGMAAWTAVLGAISLELWGHVHRVVVDADAYFEQLVARQVAQLLAPRE